MSITHPNLISEAVRQFQKGAIVVFPTETCYGIGTIGLKSNERNIERIFTIKSRPFHKPLSLLITKDMIDRYIKASSEVHRILREIWPNHVTIILNCTTEASQILSPLINLNDPQKLAFRVPNHELLLKIIKKVDIPIIGTSANKSGSTPKYNLSSIFKEIDSSEIQLWIDGGRLSEIPPSTVIDLTKPQKPILLRRGKFDVDDYFGKLR
jgi:L-threonylcarbamoyladenylate synthase